MKTNKKIKDIKIKIKFSWAWWSIPLIPALRRQRQAMMSEYKASMGYIVSSRPARARGRTCLFSYCFLLSSLPPFSFPMLRSHSRK